MFEEEDSTGNSASKSQVSQTLNELKPLLGTKTVLIRKSSTRYLALALISTILMGYNFSYFFSGGLEQTFNVRVPLIAENPIYFQLFMTVYSFPNIILPLVAGILVDKLGARICIITFTGILFIGQLIVAFGGLLDSEGFAHYWVMLSGRFIFALGGEQLFVSYMTATSQWFYGKELAMAFAIQMTIGQLSQSATPIVMTSLSTQDHYLFWPLMTCALVCLLSFAGSIAFFILDKKAELQEIALGIKQKRNAEKFQFSDLKKLNTVYWLLNINDLFLISSYIAFTTNYQGFYTSCYDVTETAASWLITIGGLLSIPTNILFGWLIDKIGKRGKILLIACLIQVLQYLCYQILPQCHQCSGIQQCRGKSSSFGVLIVPNLLFGINTSMMNISLFPSIPIVTDESVTGTAFGLLDSFQQLGAVLLTVFVGLIVGSTDAGSDIHKQCGYLVFSLFFIVISIINVVISTTILIFDARNGHKLDKVLTDDMKRSTIHLKKSLIV